MIFRPFDRALPEVSKDDLDVLVTNQVPEGLAVEYKRDFEPKKVARTVASFANTHGGTLIVGMDADKLLPREIIGIEDKGDLEERTVNVVRTSIAPTPAFTPRAVDIGGGRACLVVEVPEGLQPPYLLLRTGVVLERTPTSSEPVPMQNRDTLDRLFLRGKRGREWAQKTASELGRENTDGMRFWTVPEVEGGIGPSGRVLQQSFLDVVSAALSEQDFWPNPLSLKPRIKFGQTFSRFSIIDEIDTARGERSIVQFQVHTNGIVRSLWSVARAEGPDPDAMETMVRLFGPLHCLITEELMGHRGTVSLGFAVRWRPNEGWRRTRIVRSGIAVSDLVGIDLSQSMKREILRSQGVRVVEPEDEC